MLSTAASLLGKPIKAAAAYRHVQTITYSDHYRRAPASSLLEPQVLLPPSIVSLDLII